MSKKKSSLKSTFLLIAIIIILAALYVVKGPLTNQLDTLNAESATLQDEISSMQAYVAQMNKWQKELDDLRAEKGEDIASIPQYDNFKGIVREISELLDTEAESYSITYGEPEIKDNIVTRNLNISFTCSDYNTTLKKLTAFNESDTRYHIGNMSITVPSTGSSTVSMNMTVYEYVSTAE